MTMALERSIDNSAEMRDKPETEFFYVKSLVHIHILQWNMRMEQISKTQNVSRYEKSFVLTGKNKSTPWRRC